MIVIDCIYKKVAVSKVCVSPPASECHNHVVNWMCDNSASTLENWMSPPVTNSILGCCICISQSVVFTLEESYRTSANN